MIESWYSYGNSQIFITFSVASVFGNYRRPIVAERVVPPPFVATERKGVVRRGMGLVVRTSAVTRGSTVRLSTVANGDGFCFSRSRPPPRTNRVDVMPTLSAERLRMRIEPAGGRSSSGPKVLHVLDNLGVGGAETWLMEVLRFWHRTGSDAAQFDFLATGGVPSYYDEEAKRYGANIFYLRYGQAHLMSFVPGLRQILCSGQYAAIHDHADYTAGWHFLMASGTLPPVRAVHVHNPAFQIQNKYGATRTRRFAMRVGKSLVARYATHILGTSRQVIGEYGFDAAPFKNITRMALYCGIDTSPHGDIADTRQAVRNEFGWPENACVVLVAGRIDPSPDFYHPWSQKNSGFAVAVGIKAAQENANICMILAGAKSAAVPILDQQITTASLAQRIRFIGVRDDLRRLMYASDILLFPSRGEGLGMVAVEAQAAGLPVLTSTNVPRECVIVPELVRYEQLQRGVDAWAATLLEHVALRRDGVAANQRVASSQFSIENSAAALLSLYRQGL